MTTDNQSARVKLQDACSLTYKLMGVLESFTEEEINELDKASQDRLGTATEKASTAWKLLRLCRINPLSHQDQPTATLTQGASDTPLRGITATPGPGYTSPASPAIDLTSPGTGYHGEEARIQEFPLSFLRQAAKNAENNPKD